MFPEKKSAVNLRTVAERVGLAPCTVSAVLNNTPASDAIPQTTKDRIFRAAAELSYRPNLWARSLRTKQTRMVAAVTPDFGSGPVARVVAGLQNRLYRKGYLLALGAADFTEANGMFAQLQQRGIEGIIAIDANVPRQMELPVASVSLGYMSALEPLTEDMQAWLSELGEAAAETIIRQVETKTSSRRMKVDPKLPPAYFGLPTGATGLGARESA
jgi:hypothetical protein